MGETSSEKKKISYTEFCNLTGASPHVRFYLMKLYKTQQFTFTNWKNKIK